MLFNELRLHGKLAAKRHPKNEKNKIGKYIMYASFIFWGAYFIFIGIGLAKAISTEVPNMEDYHILNSGLIFALALDFVIRYPFQKTPTQEVKPYLLLPVKRSRILDFLLLRHGLSSFNLIWLFLYETIAALTDLDVPVRAVRITHRLSFLWNIRSSHLQHRHLVTDGFQRILVSALPYAD